MWRVLKNSTSRRVTEKSTMTCRELLEEQMCRYFPEVKKHFKVSIT